MTTLVIIILAGGLIIRAINIIVMLILATMLLATLSSHPTLPDVCMSSPPCPLPFITQVNLSKILTTVDLCKWWEVALCSV
jgi:hypothetical protein